MEIDKKQICELTAGADHGLLLEIENHDDANSFALIGRALSAPIRIEILRMLNKRPMLVSEIAKTFDLQLSSAAFHMRVLEDAKLVNVDYSQKKKSTLKWYSYSNKTIILQMREARGNPQLTPPAYTQTIPIGEFTDIKLSSNCGMATENDLIMSDKPNFAFLPERRDIQILWTKDCGFIEYTLPNQYVNDGKISEISFSMELCSEARGYNPNYPSDITFWINGVEVCTFFCPGDFGDRYGKFTPSWWFPESTKYGLLTTVCIRDKGVFLNENLVNKKITLDKINLAQGNKTVFRLGVKEDAEHRGGINIFGEKFGDYNQPIIFTAVYEKLMR